MVWRQGGAIFRERPGARQALVNPLLEILRPRFDLPVFFSQTARLQLGDWILYAINTSLIVKAIATSTNEPCR